MVKVRGFQGIVAKPEIASEIASRPYDVISREEAKQLANGKDHSYYNVIRPEINLPDSVYEHDHQVYSLGQKKLTEFIEKGYIKKDDSTRFYVYQTEFQGIVCVGLFLLASIKEYERHIVKRHELTRKDKELDRTHLIDSQNANSEPILITYQSVDTIEDLLEQIIQTQPYINAQTTDDDATHKLWLVPTDLSKFIEDQFNENVDSLYIADGHHRMAASTNVAQKRREQLTQQGIELTGEELFEYIMAYTVSSKYLKICGYHRIIKSLKNLTYETVLEKLSQDFEIRMMSELENKQPQQKGQYSFLLGNEWFSLNVKKESIEKLLGLNPKPSDKIDVSVLQELCITPIFDIQDIRTDKNIEFIGGDNIVDKIEQKITQDGNAVAIVCYPVNVRELFEIADNQQIMMPKSTWIIPKPRSGLVMRMIH